MKVYTVTDLTFCRSRNVFGLYLSIFLFIVSVACHKKSHDYHAINDVWDDIFPAIF